jgi:hypothetical protein
MVDRHLMRHGGWKDERAGTLRLGLLSGVLFFSLWISMMLSISQQVVLRSFGVSSITIWESIGHGD